MKCPTCGHDDRPAGWKPGRRRVMAIALMLARRRYERGDPVARIAIATGLSRQTIYTEAKAQKWRRPKQGATK